MQYADLLLLAGASSGIQTVFNKWFPPENTYQLKEKIRHALLELKQPVFILIDDLDRLNADEIFELLRLIRNTANFPALIFIVAFDKDYVIEQLQKKHVFSPYLEKIFMIDLPLPLLGDECMAYTILKEKLKETFSDWDVTLQKLSFVQRRLIGQVLPTPRKVERFARLLLHE